MPQTTRGSNIEVPNQKALIQGTNFRGAENEVSGEKAAVRDPSENPEKEKHMSQSQRSLESDDASWVTTPSSAAEEAHLQKLHEDMFATLQHSVEDLNVFEDLSLYLKPKPKTTCKHEDLQTSIQRTVPLDVKSLSDPSVIHRIPFPSTDFNKPRNRFKLDEQNNAFSFYGREHMTPLIERVRKLGKGSTCRELVVIGPQGVGKSHSLAALVAFLRKTGEVTCVYISHANFLLQDAFSCIKSAFLDAFNLDGLKIAEIKKMEKTEQLVDFMREVTSSDTRVLFVIDQVDVLEPQAKEEEDFSNDTKRSVKEILNKLSYGQPVVKGASANYRQGCFNIWDAHDMSTFDLYHGLTS